MLLKSAKISAEVRFGLSNRHLSISVAIIREFFGLLPFCFDMINNSIAQSMFVCRIIYSSSCIILVID